MIREKSLFLQDVLNTFDKNNKKTYNKLWNTILEPSKPNGKKSGASAVPTKWRSIPRAPNSKSSICSPIRRVRVCT